MAEKFPVKVVPIKLVSVSEEDITAFRVMNIGWQIRSTYVETPHQYVVDSADVLIPSFMGDSKKTRWVTGWVHLKVLSNKYPEDEFLQQCVSRELRADHSLASFMEVEGEDAVNVRVVTPVKIRPVGFFHPRPTLRQG